MSAAATLPSAAGRIERIQQIRARLGDWPAGAPWRVCLTPPAEAGAYDLLIASEGAASERAQAQCLAAGGGVLQAGSRGITLRFRDRAYALAAEPGADWLPALAAFLDCGFVPHDALCLALAWRTGDEQREDAWPVELARFPRVLGLPAPPPRAFRACPAALGVYPIVPDAAWVERLLAAGGRTIQLRCKQAAFDGALADQVNQAVAAAARAGGARLFINDHWRLALDAGAYGVHLGQEDLPGADLAPLAAAGMRLGLSSHGYYEILVALHFRPSYIAVGSIFATATKSIATAPQGLARLRRYVQLLEGAVPLVAIGGISRASLPAVAASGVKGVAVAGAITGAVDPEAVLMELGSMLRGRSIS